MIQIKGKPGQSPEMILALRAWWRELTLKGDPSLRPNLAWEAFEAGYMARDRLTEAAPALLQAIVNSDDAHWTPAMRAAIERATGNNELR